MLLFEIANVTANTTTAAVAAPWLRESEMMTEPRATARQSRSLAAATATAVAGRRCTGAGR